MSNKILQGVALAAVLAYSGLAAAKNRAPDPELGLAIASQGNQALVTIREESRIALVKPEVARVSEASSFEAAPASAGGSAAAATERCAE